MDLLKNGTSADDIAAAFTKELNDALEAKREEDERAKATDNLLVTAADCITKYCATKVGEKYADLVAVNPDELRKGLDSLLELVPVMGSLVKKMNAKTPKTAPKSADEILDDFLSSLT